MKKMTCSAYNTSASSGHAYFSGTSASSNVSPQGFLQMNPIRLTDEEKLLFEPAKYSIFEIANWFLLKESMTHKKLQKLCYYAQAWFYALRDIRLSDATFEAWVHGPVSPALYDKFKPFGYSAIKLASEYSTAVLPEDADLLESVWVTYGDRTGNALEALSHNETPWIEARLGYESDERCEVVISPGSMKKYYRSIYLDGDTQ